MSSANRDIYLAINDLVTGLSDVSERDLEMYLRALLAVTRSQRDIEVLTVQEFVESLAKGFTVEPVPYDSSWSEKYRLNTNELHGYEKCEATLLQQIVDLREMQEAGILDGEWINFGVDSPRGNRWYNFSPQQYLECAAAGAIGGWESEDSTGRAFVPGLVAGMDATGSITLEDPRGLERPVYPVIQVTWEQFVDFLKCGQFYE